MYAAKERGKGAYAIYDFGMHAATVARAELRADLARAIADDEVGLAYQPIADLQTGVIRAYETLARWEHPTRGPISPCEFIPLAEETGLIVPLGRQLLREACRQAARWRQACTVGDPLRISVNLSARQFADEALVDDVRAAVQEAGIDPGSVVLEVTESAIMADVELAAARMAELREFGVGIAVDDFGTGYSSLNSILRFPVDRLKIDRSFVQQLGDRRMRAIIEMIVDLGAMLDMIVVVEGIEEPEQLQALVELGVGWGQGFLLQRPVGPEQVLEDLEQRGRWITLPEVAAA
jgi:EAL domain-containing protein (putative c-di-GMP-specific phosphodiesterase class I)